jgi:hypothetical protein
MRRAPPNMSGTASRRAPFCVSSFEALPRTDNPAPLVVSLPAGRGSAFVRSYMLSIFESCSAAAWQAAPRLVGRLAFLDTRTKIISQEEALQRVQGQQQPAQWVAASFDPLLAEHVRLLRRYVAPGRRLVVEITNPPRPLLAQRARAELVAALGMVDYVVLKNGEPELSQDAVITERFIQHVLRRHHPEGTG